MFRSRSHVAILLSVVFVAGCVETDPLVSSETTSEKDETLQEGLNWQTANGTYAYEAGELRGSIDGQLVLLDLWIPEATSFDFDLQVRATFSNGRENSSEWLLMFETWDDNKSIHYLSWATWGEYGAARVEVSGESLTANVRDPQESVFGGHEQRVVTAKSAEPLELGRGNWSILIGVHPAVQLDIALTLPPGLGVSTLDRQKACALVPMSEFKGTYVSSLVGPAVVVRASYAHDVATGMTAWVKYRVEAGSAEAAIVFPDGTAQRERQHLGEGVGNPMWVRSESTGAYEFHVQQTAAAQLLGASIGICAW